MASAQTFGTTSNWIAIWFAVEMGRYGNARVKRAQRLCQRCDASTVDNVEHMIFVCVAMDVERQKPCLCLHVDDLLW